MRAPGADCARPRGARRAFVAAALAVAALSGCGERGPGYFPGYAEGEYVRVASPIAGTLDTLAVRRGDTPAAGAPLFTLESEQERAARAQAGAQLAQAEASLADLEKGRRPPEIGAARAQLAQAEASLRQSEADLARTQKLVADRFLPPQQLDAALAARDRNRAQVAQLSLEVEIATLPARSDAIAAATAAAKAARDALAQAQWRVDQKSQAAPVAGLVDDTYYLPGEWVAAGAPVVSLLPPGNVKVVFYVPEPQLAQVRVGERVDVRCDGCDRTIAAKVRFVSPQAEFTPPVIYSRELRAKLVYRVEAWPQTPVPGLHPGLPVEVTAATASPK
ncbi:MAG: HlyD family efflux transporter periplasmic adaptor subunit [Proteobacteria bacterium]|nr:HlyD family efflux transporter periplasmic adaptor subunit [Pseudomonadota bacterium]